MSPEVSSCAQLGLLLPLAVPAAMAQLPLLPAGCNATKDCCCCCCHGSGLEDPAWDAPGPVTCCSGFASCCFSIAGHTSAWMLLLLCRCCCCCCSDGASSPKNLDFGRSSLCVAACPPAAAAAAMLHVPPKLLLALLLTPPQLPPAATGAAAAAAAAAMLLPPILLLRLLVRPAATAAAAVTSSQFSADLLLPIDVRLPPALPPANTHTHHGAFTVTYMHLSPFRKRTALRHQ
jgi:hypothetical protein